jgi:two-component system OmpR family sensor kinase
MNGGGLERLAVLVHEVRSPVAALAAIEGAFARASAAERRSLTALAVGASRGIERIVADVAVSSIAPRDVDVVRLAEEAASGARLQGSVVRVVAPAGVTAVGDPVRLRQALDNLLSNAARHAPGGAVVIEVAAGNGMVEVSVSDRGPGIAPQDLERVFEPGVRSGAEAGSGLGLALARAIAEAHGGTLTVTSRPGEGATFTLAVPREAGGG